MYVLNKDVMMMMMMIFSLIKVIYFEIFKSISILIIYIYLFI